MLQGVPVAAQINVSAAAHDAMILAGTEETYTVTYDMNGGSSTIGAQTKGQTITLRTDIPTRAGDEFLGWNTNVNAQTAEYQPVDVYEKDLSINLNAVWKEIPLVNETELSRNIIIIGEAVQGKEPKPMPFTIRNHLLPAGR